MNVVIVDVGRLSVDGRGIRVVHCVHDVVYGRVPFWNVAVLACGLGVFGQELFDLLHLAVHYSQGIAVADGPLAMNEAMDAVHALELVALVGQKRGVFAVARDVVHDLFRRICHGLCVLAFEGLLIQHARVDVRDEQGVLVWRVRVLTEVDEICLQSGARAFCSRLSYGACGRLQDLLAGVQSHGLSGAGRGDWDPQGPGLSQELVGLEVVSFRELFELIHL